MGLDRTTRNLFFGPFEKNSQFSLAEWVSFIGNQRGGWGMDEREMRSEVLAGTKSQRTWTVMPGSPHFTR